MRNFLILVFGQEYEVHCYSLYKYTLRGCYRIRIFEKCAYFRSSQSSLHAKSVYLTCIKCDKFINSEQDTVEEKWLPSKFVRDHFGLYFYLFIYGTLFQVNARNTFAQNTFIQRRFKWTSLFCIGVEKTSPSRCLWDVSPTGTQYLSDVSPMTQHRLRRGISFHLTLFNRLFVFWKGKVFALFYRTLMTRAYTVWKK